MAYQNETCELFNATVRNLLPLSYVNARVYTVLGEDTITIDFAINQKWANNIIHNDPLHTRVLVQKEGDSYVIESSYVPTRVLKSIGVTFRKIRAKTEDEAVAKLAQWFGKNAEYLKLLGEY